MTDARRRFTDNPFYILGVSPQRTRVEIEREGAKLLGMLALGLRSASTYETPAGPRERTEEDVRAALAQLRVPDRRLLHELWASAPQVEATPAGEATTGSEAEETMPGDPYRDPAPAGPPASEAGAEHPGFIEAFALFGWRRP